MSSVPNAPGQRRRLGIALALLSLMLCVAGLAAGSEGWALGDVIAAGLGGGVGSDAGLVVGQIRAPRTLGAWLTGALLGLAGAVAQGLFRNPLADPFLLGSAAGASFAVTVVLAAGGVLLTLVLARGAQQTTRLLLAGVVVGVVLSALGDLLTTAAPEALRGRQVFMLGSTGFLGWASVVLLALGLAVTAPLAWRLARVLDALTLGEDSARSLGLALPRLRLVLVAVLALATGLAVSQAGLVAFVGLVSPHLVRRFAPSPHGYTLLASAATGGVLLLAADVLARTLIAPQELPVGVLTALLGGSYLLWLLHRRGPG